MRLLTDLYPCQTPSRLRGIGRYSLSLTLELARQRGEHEFIVLADALYPESLDELRRQFIRLLPSGAFLPYYHWPFSSNPRQNAQPISRIAETLIEQAYQVVAPDIVLTPSLFEGWGDMERGWVPVPRNASPGHRRAIILYDLIPFIFQERYLDPNPPLKQWYLERMELLHEYDLLLAISEATRQDAIHRLRIPPERVVNISGAASSNFKKLFFTGDEREAWLRRLGISREFVLYIGGNDYRKNMEGALRAYARLPRSLTAGHQLVLNDVGDEEVFRRKARALGLQDSDLVIIKRLEDSELEALYNICKLFVFPSLYEGFGLPILEAMTCGAPVIASGTSSLPEVVGRSDALFDPSKDEAVTAALHKALTDDAYRADLAAYGPSRAARFSWQESARLAWEAINALQESQRSEPRVTAPGFTPERRLRIAHVSPLPPQESGIAMYCAGLLPHLAEHVDLDLFTQPDIQVSDPVLTAGFKILPWTALPERRDEYDAVIYHMGNSELHIPMLELIDEIPGVVVSHDFFLSNLPFVQAARSGQSGPFLKEMDFSHGLRGLLDYAAADAQTARWDWPMNWRVLRNAQELIVHSRHQKELLARFYGRGWLPAARIVRQSHSVADSRERRAAARRDLGLSSDTLVFCSFGFMAETKLNLEVIEAFARILPALQRPAALVFVGEQEGAEYGREVRRLLKELRLGAAVTITGYSAPQQYQMYLDGADVAVQLRSHSRGETSAALLDCLAHGLPTITNAHGSFAEYGSDIVLSLPESPRVEDLADAMLRMGVDDDFRLDLGDRARRYIQAEHNPTGITEQISKVLHLAAQTNEQALFAPLVDALSILGSPAPLIRSCAVYAASNRTLRAQPRILLDLTGFVQDPAGGPGTDGVADLVRGLFSIADPAIHVELVQRRDGRLLRAAALAETILGRAEHRIPDGTPVEIKPGDVLLLVGHLLQVESESAPIFDTVRQRGGRLVTLVSASSTQLLDTPARESDFILCTSQQVAAEIRRDLHARVDASARTIGVYYVRSEVGVLDAASAGAQASARPAYEMQEPSADSAPPRLDQLAGWLLDVSADGAGFAAEVDVQVGDSGDMNHTPPGTTIATGATMTTSMAHDEVRNGASVIPRDDPLARSTPDQLLGPPMLRSVACSQAALESEVFQDWVGRFGGRRGWMHRKPWEWAYICQALHERGLLKPGSRGLGFAVGTEPLPALFASYGCEILATDLRTDDAVGKSWIETGQHGSALSDLLKPEILPEPEFLRRVGFRFVDMTSIDPDLRGFDFVWSSCSLEHLGTLDKGRQFILESLECLKPGGVAVHTTEYNVSSNQDTKEEGPDVIYRRRDLEDLGRQLRASRHGIDLDFTLGNGPLDLYVDQAPFKQDVHLRLELWGYVCTSFGLIIRKAP